MKKPGKKAKRRMIAATKRAPVWMQTAIIGERVGRPAPIRGSFGAASPVVSIDPQTGLPRQVTDGLDVAV